MIESEEPEPAGLIVLMGGAGDDLAARIRDRLDYEFGVSAAPEPIEVRDAGEVRGGGDVSRGGEVHAGGAGPDRWFALERWIDPAQLIDIQLHASRLEELYAAQADGDLELVIGYIDSARVVRAARTDGEGRLYLGKGVWGEIALARGSSGTYEPTPWAGAAWKTPEAARFLNAAARRTAPAP